MFKRNATAIIGILFWAIFLGTWGLVFSSELTVRLHADIEDRHLDEFTKIEAGFILSGVEDPDSLAQ